MKKFLLTIAILLGAAGIASAQYDKDVFMWRGRQALSEGRYALAIENFNVLSRLDTTYYWSFFFYRFHSVWFSCRFITILRSKCISKLLRN